MENYNAYEALWRYLVEFQRIPMILQNTIQSVLNQYWLRKDFWRDAQDNIIARVILAERGVDDLLNIYLHLMAIIFNEESDDFKVIKKITTFIKDETLSHRNNLVHSFLFVDKDNINDIHMCREKFTGKTWFRVEKVPNDYITKQIKTISRTADILHYINRNFEESKSIIGELKYGDIVFDISIKSINQEIEDLKKNNFKI